MDGGNLSPLNLVALNKCNYWGMGIQGGAMVRAVPPSTVGREDSHTAIWNIKRIEIFA